jgi:hypothetical protein
MRVGESRGMSGGGRKHKKGIFANIPMSQMISLVRVGWLKISPMLFHACI